MGDIDKTWQTLDPEIVGANLLADELIAIAPDNVFDPSFPNCFFRGMVPPIQPIKLLERPTGHVVGVNLHETIFSTRICRLFQKYVIASLGDVIYRNAVIPNWHRFFPNQRRNVIATACLRTSHCIHCNGAITGDSGVLLGHRVADLTVCQIERGIDHSDAVHPYIVSPEIAQELEATLGKGYGLQPIIDVESEPAKRMLETYDRLRKMLVPR